AAAAPESSEQAEAPEEDALEQAAAEEEAAAEEPAAEEAPAEEAPAEEAPAEDVPAEYTSALTSAETYADVMHMSKQAIYDQLTSEFDQFSEEAAQYAIDNL